MNNPVCKYNCNLAIFSNISIEHAKWQSWDRQRPEEAISILRKGIEDKFPWYKRDFNRKTTTAPRDQVCLEGGPSEFYSGN